ncbi:MULTISPECIES: NUDIX hydrolase [unclassified Acinetobacter]|jgi:8-oxo-dGTP pyrophosphatase MutT (NUDIX family)|uniref:NUDIX hydrolase n=1 Tax=unclassified Acinetobacter TaxID=196816 RepID=UPI00124E5E50|nr:MULTISPECIES: NUDIX domain-containing protein [unclassified Acinetobacter]
MTLIEKVVPVIFRNISQKTEILVFKHPIAGIQIVKGTVEVNEELETAALRELYEESGILSAHIHSYLGLHHPSEQGPNWHVFICHSTEALKEHWTHFCNDDGGLEFNFFWHPLFESPSAEWHPLFQELLTFIKSKIEP